MDVRTFSFRDSYTLGASSVGPVVFGEKLRTRGLVALILRVSGTARDLSDINTIRVSAGSRLVHNIALTSLVKWLRYKMRGRRITDTTELTIYVPFHGYDKHGMPDFRQMWLWDGIQVELDGDSEVNVMTVNVAGKYVYDAGDIANAVECLSLIKKGISLANQTDQVVDIDMAMKLDGLLMDWTSVSRVKVQHNDVVVSDWASGDLQEHNADMGAAESESTGLFLDLDEDSDGIGALLIPPDKKTTKLLVDATASVTPDLVHCGFVTR